MNQTLVFIDADNQPPGLATPLARFLASIARESSRAIVAGNGAGGRVHGWEQALLAALPGIDVQCHVAPLRKQSADVRLMFELARVYHSEPDPSALILVLSRDDLLLAATECLVAKGHNAMIAVGSSANGTPVVADLPIVVLPSPQSAATSAQPAPVAALLLRRPTARSMAVPLTSTNRPCQLRSQGSSNLSHPTSKVATQPPRSARSWPNSATTRPRAPKSSRRSRT